MGATHHVGSNPTRFVMYRWTFRAYNKSTHKQIPDLVHITVFDVGFEGALAKAKDIPGIKTRKIYELTGIAEMSTGS